MYLLNEKEKQLFFNPRQRGNSIAIDIVDINGEHVQDFLDIRDGSVFVDPIPNDIRARLGMSLSYTDKPLLPNVYVRGANYAWDLTKVPVKEEAKPIPEVYPIDTLEAPPLIERSAA